MRLEHLPHIHARGHAEGVEHDVHRSAVLKVGHVFLGNDLGDHALVTVAAGHFVADRKLALGGDVNLHLLHHARIHIRAGFHAIHFVDVGRFQILKALEEGSEDFVDLIADRRGINFDLIVNTRQLAQEGFGNLAIGGDDDFARLAIDHIERNFFAEQNVRQRLGELLLQIREPFLVFISHLLFTLFVGAFGVLFLFGGNLHIHHDAISAAWHFKGRILHVGGFLAKDSPQQTLFRRQFSFALGRDFADENVARFHFCAHANDPIGTQIRQRFLADIRNVARDFFRAKLGVACAHFVFRNVDGGKYIILHHAFAEHNGVLKVVSIPRHKRHEHILAERQFAIFGAGAIGDYLPLLHGFSQMHQRFLVHASASIGAHKLAQFIHPNATFGIVFEFPLAGRHLAVLGDDDAFAGNGGNLARHFGFYYRARILSQSTLHTRRHQRRLSDEQRHGLALHVRAHQRAVRVIVLEEGNQPRCHGDQLLGRHIHVMNALGFHIDEIASAPARHKLGQKFSLVVNLRIGLSHREVFLGIGGKVIELIRDAPFLHLAIGAFEKAEIIHTGKGCEARDEADVRAFGSFHRANAAVMARVHIAHPKARALAREAARAQRGQAPLVCRLRQRVDLVHELAELTAAKKVANHRGERLRVHQFCRRHRAAFAIEKRHAFLHQPLCAGKPHAALVGE